MPDASCGRTGVDGDLPPERAVLFGLFDLFPAQLRLEDLVGRVTQFHPESGFGDTEAVKEAVAELDGFGLLSRHGDPVIPTPAALHFDLLELSTASQSFSISKPLVASSSINLAA